MPSCQPMCKIPSADPIPQLHDQATSVPGCLPAELAARKTRPVKSEKPYSKIVFSTVVPEGAFHASLPRLHGSVFDAAQNQAALVSSVGKSDKASGKA